MRWVWVVPPEEESAKLRADRRILAALNEIPPAPEPGARAGDIFRCSRSQLQNWIEGGRVTADGAPLKPGVPLLPGVRIEIEIPTPEPLELVPEERTLEILFEDPDLAVINKPQGLTVHPSPTQRTGTLVHAALHRFGSLAPAGGAERPGIVHRIDKDTSGAIVLAKTDAAYHGLVPQFAQHSIERTYWALCFGAPQTNQGKVESTIGRSLTERTRMAMNVSGGRRAVTHFKVLKRFAKPNARSYASWLELQLETGRTHQIRVHLDSLGASILGDSTYGTPSERHPKWLALSQPVREAVITLTGQSLHARTLGFKHPISGETIRVEAEPPPSFRALLTLLEKDS